MFTYHFTPSPISHNLHKSDRLLSFEMYLDKHHLPKELSLIIKGCKFHQNTIGESRSHVYEIENTDKEKRYYLKINEPEIGYELMNSFQILKWINSRLPVPRVLYYSIQDGKEYLLQEKIKGVISFSQGLYAKRKLVLELLASGLSKIHSLSHEDLPSSLIYTNKRLLQLAEKRLKKGLVDRSHFDIKWQHEDPYHLLARLKEKNKEFTEQLVFSHGDYCLPNILIHKNTISGFIDWIHGGVYDQHYDLAAVIWSITWNFGEKYVQEFLKLYGKTDVTWDKIRFYQQINSFL